MTVAERRKKRGTTLPARFTPFFWVDSDGRCSITKEIRRRYEQLKRDTGCNSYQKDLLVQRAVFIGVQLETLECRAAAGEEIDVGVYTQMSNSLLGYLKSLGLEPHMKQVGDLKSYVESKS